MGRQSGAPCPAQVEGGAPCGPELEGAECLVSGCPGDFDPYFEHYECTDGRWVFTYQDGHDCVGGNEPTWPDAAPDGQPWPDAGPDARADAEPDAGPDARADAEPGAEPDALATDGGACGPLDAYLTSCTDGERCVNGPVCWEDTEHFCPRGWRRVEPEDCEGDLYHPQPRDAGPDAPP